MFRRTLIIRLFLVFRLEMHFLKQLPILKTLEIQRLKLPNYRQVPQCPIMLFRESKFMSE